MGGHRPLTLTLQYNEASGPSSPSSVQNSRGPPTLAFLGEDVGAPIFKREARGTQKPMARGGGGEAKPAEADGPLPLVPCHSE